MPTHDGFLQAIRDEPDSDVPRLIYADWLDDHGDPARAEFIRTQCERERLPPGDPRQPALEEREEDLLAAHEPSGSPRSRTTSASGPSAAASWRG